MDTSICLFVGEVLHLVSKNVSEKSFNIYIFFIFFSFKRHNNMYIKEENKNVFVCVSGKKSIGDEIFENFCFGSWFFLLDPDPDYRSHLRLFF